MGHNNINLWGGAEIWSSQSLTNRTSFVDHDIWSQTHLRICGLTNWSPSWSNLKNAAAKKEAPNILARTNTIEGSFFFFLTSTCASGSSNGPPSKVRLKEEEEMEEKGIQRRGGGGGKGGGKRSGGRWGGGGERRGIERRRRRKGWRRRKEKREGKMRIRIEEEIKM